MRWSNFQKARSIFYTAPAPDDFVSSLSVKENPIFILEIYAAILGASIIKDTARTPLSALLFIDNNAAIVTILKGHCPRSILASRAIFHFWRTFNLSGRPVWVERVESARNLADEPSRRARPHFIKLPFPRFDAPF